MKTKRWIAVAAAIVTASCGGGGGGNGGAAGTAEGLWRGIMGTNRAIAGIVEPDGTYWVIYSTVGDHSILSGMVQGTGVSDNGVFTSSNALDINLEGLGPNLGTVDADYVQKASFDGTVAGPGGGSVIFNSLYDADYESTPTLASLAGVYTGTEFFTPEAAVITISAGGTFSGVGADGCQADGTVTANPSGNFYDVSATLGAACSNPGMVLTGIAYLDSIGTTLTTSALNGARNVGFLFAGTKP